MWVGVWFGLPVFPKPKQNCLWLQIFARNHSISALNALERPYRPSRPGTLSCHPPAGRPSQGQPGLQNSWPFTANHVYGTTHERRGYRQRFSMPGGLCSRRHRLSETTVPDQRAPPQVSHGGEVTTQNPEP